MTRNQRIIVWIACVAAIGIGVGVAFYFKSVNWSEFGQGGLNWKTTSWRVRLVARKAIGGLPDLSWNELWFMMRKRGGFGLASLVTGGRGLYASVISPLVTPEDREYGGVIFRQRCAVCHGDQGVGQHAPPLNRSGLRHGDSDLAIYKVVRDGIPGTGMVRVAMSTTDRWQVVGYVHTLQTAASRKDDERPAAVNIHVSGEQLLAAGSNPEEWLTYSGSLDGRRYSPLAEITPQNVARLRLRWIHQFDTSEQASEATPIVVGGVVFITEAPSNVVALDIRSGEVLWRYRRTLPETLPTCCFRLSRGLAILGSRLFLASLDGSLVALDAATGTVIWETSVAKPSDGYTLTGAPLIARGSVVVGVAGGEYGIRGFLAAYDAETGRQQWKFNTIPGPGEFGHDSWKSDAWQTGGGPTWVTGSYDPALDLVYWGVGNPSPNFQGDVRPGDNLFTDSMLALQASSGKLAWYFQFTPHDEHDWDSTQTPILADVTIQGAARQVLCVADRNGFYYVLDRTTGEFLAGVPYVQQNWAIGLDPKGRPILSPNGTVSNSGRLTRPGIAGGTDWRNMAFDRQIGTIFVPATEGASVFTKSANAVRGDNGFYAASDGPLTEPPAPVVRALDVATGAKKWEWFSPPSKDPTFSYSGLLATGGGLVFGAAGGAAFALDSTTGRELWRMFLGGTTNAGPISVRLDEHQVVIVAVGRDLVEFGL